ncbi:hypothetical protein EW146_g7506 [Bondarzewia mesenterica]|uniref:TOG domain-containing protein n=1 Tax=Bondarzewia mesenterica TaxID=1095465 RepID=A0A4S4LMG9_9AGAM|nr:hypothetical protein EW146_g7506 [Bondarzewia mesenterica]
MEEQEPPPTAHTLRPHHVSLLTIIMMVFKHWPRSHFTATFLLHVYRVLMHEVAEIAQPSSYQGFITLLLQGPDANTEGARMLFDSLEPSFSSLDHFTNFFHGISYLFIDTKTDVESDTVDRFLAIFVEDATSASPNFLGSWTGYERIEKDLITYNTVLLKTHADEYEWAQPGSYAEFERGLTIADTNLASENLRRFFEQHFHDGNDSGVRQHALLNLSRMYYVRHEYAASRKFLTEAIDVARTANDKETLQQCQRSFSAFRVLSTNLLTGLPCSLLHRLPMIQAGQKPVLTEIQPGLHPLEVLFDVEKLMRVSSEQPLSAAFEKIAQAVGLYDHWIDVQGHLPEHAEQWSQHAVQSFVWSAAGCDKLAAIEENIVTAFTEAAGDDNNAITVNLNRAYRRARQGKYQSAIAMLLEPDVWRGLNISDFGQWATQIWHILVLRASRRGQDRLYHDFLKPLRPPGPFNPKEYFFVDSGPPASIIRGPLYDVLHMRQADQGAVSVEKLLRALWHAEFQCRFGSYRTGIILLADVGLEFGMTKRCSTQIITGDDLEQRALGCFTFARCTIAAGNRSAESIREALPYLDIAEKDYATLEILRSLADVQYFISVLYHNLGMPTERDRAAERHLITEEERKMGAVVSSETWVSQVWDLATMSIYLIEWWVDESSEDVTRRSQSLAESRRATLGVPFESRCAFVTSCHFVVTLHREARRKFVYDNSYLAFHHTPSPSLLMDGPPPQEEDLSSLPIQDRLSHKNWKARVSAYETLIKTFQLTVSDTDPAFKPYLNDLDLLKKIATDSNAVAQEKGVECLVALVKFAGENAARTREVVVPSLVDKCYGSTRAGTKNQALELTLQYVEVENGGGGVVDNILPGLGAKQPKVVAGAVNALKEIVRQFGTQVTPPTAILKSLPKIFGHSDKTVRAEGTNLTHVLYQYLGAGIEPWLSDLKPVQVKELKEVWEAMEKDGKGKGTLKPERMTRQQARDAEAVEAAGGDGPDEIPTEEDLLPPDPRQFAEEIDIVSKLPSNFHANLTSSKWKERKEALDDLLTLLDATLRIKDVSELGELAKSLATRIQADANINCVMSAAQCMESLAKGMSNAFARHRETVVPPMLERLKERKTSVTDSIGVALDAVFNTTTLGDILGDLQPALHHKNPQVKEGTLKFLTRCLATSTQPIPPAQIKPVSEALAALLEDSFAGARDEAAVAFGTLMKMIGERPLGLVMDGLADVRKVKVKEAFEKATVKARAGAGGPPKTAPPPSAAKVPPKKVSAAIAKKKESPTVSTPSPSVEDVDHPPSPAPPKPKGPPARLLAKKAPAPTAATGASGGSGGAAAPAKKPSPAAAAAASKPAKGAAAPTSGALDTFKYKHTPEDAEILAADLIPANIATDFADANWKTRLAALDEMTTWVEGTVEDLDAEVVVRFLAKKGWSLGQAVWDPGHSCRTMPILRAILKKPAGDALLVFAEKTSLQFVLGQAYEPLGKTKAPKALADAITWIQSALTDFGIAGLSLRNLIEFLKLALKNSNAAVRTSATKTLVTVKLFAGSSIKDLLEDLNPQLLATIQSEFDKVEGQSAPEPTRTSADLVNMAPQGGAAGKAASAIGDPLDDLFPRVEIDGLLKGTTILADAKSEAWKAKKEALETLQAILDQGANKRLKPQMGEIGQVLKARVTDANKAVQMLALDIVSRIATGMGKPFEKQTRFFVLPVATVVSDQKAPIRSAALQTLAAIAIACESMEPLIHGLSTALETNNPVQRANLLNWLVEWFKEHELTPGLDLSGWVAPVVSCLDDRSGDVRKGAQGILPFLIASAGFDRVLHQTNSLKPASKASAVPLINAARTVAPASSSTPALSAPTAVPAKAPAPTKAAPLKAAPPTATIPSSSSATSPPQSPTMPAPTTSKAPTNKLTGIRRKLPQGTIPRPDSRTENQEEAPVSRLPGKAGTGIGFGLRRPGMPVPSMLKTVPVPDAAVSVLSASMPFFGMNLEAKRLRLAKDAAKWINEAGATRKDLADLLQHQMEPHASKDLVSYLFSHDHNAVNDHVSGLTSMCDFYSQLQAGDNPYGLSPDDLKTVGIANCDLTLKYVSIKVHEPQSNLVSKCLDVVDAVLGFMKSIDYQLTEPEALCFIPTLVYKLGDAREPVRVHVQQIFQTLSKVYAYSRVFQILLEYGLKSKVAKTRQLTLDELGSILKRSGLGACEPQKACPTMASTIADKDPNVRKSALSTLSEVFVLVGEKIWSLVGPLSPKDKTQLEERLRRVAGPSSPDKQCNLTPAPPSHVARLASGIARPGSPSTVSSRTGAIPRPASPSIGASSRLSRPTSPAASRSMSPAPSQIGRTGPSSPSSRGKSLLPSRLGPARSRTNTIRSHLPTPASAVEASEAEDPKSPSAYKKSSTLSGPHIESWRSGEPPEEPDMAPTPSNDITLTISSILSTDSERSVDALKKIQKVLQLGPDAGPASSSYRDLAEHTEGLIETVTLQIGHAFDRPESNIRLAKHLIQTLNAFCDNPLLAESLTVDNLTPLLEELATRLLQTDDSLDNEVKNLSRFINMIMLRLFSTGRRITVFRALFALLLQIVKPFPTRGTSADSQDAKVAELVLKCIWKLARNIPQDLVESKLDPVELLPAVEHFLQSVPPNEWRARATNRVPCGDMPLRTVKVIIQHVVAHFGDDVYDILSSSFDDPSATIVYPYVYRILNSSTARQEAGMPVRHNGLKGSRSAQTFSPPESRAESPLETASSAASGDIHPSSPSHRTSRSVTSINNLVSPPVEEPDPDAQLLQIIGHISSETTGAMHKEGITELHHFLKAYPHKRSKVEKMLEATGPAFRKYISRALASRAAEDEERDVAVADTLSKLESKRQDALPMSPRADSRSPRSPASRASGSDLGTSQDKQDKLSRLHDIFQYRTSTVSNVSSHGRATPLMPSARTEHS